MAEIQLKGASMTYPNGTKALVNVDLTVKDHEFLVLVGPSGCGKTTLLRLAAGLEKPTSGDVFFDGKLVNDVSPMQRNVSMVFQTFALYPHLNVYKNIAFPLKSMKLKQEEVQRRVEETAQLLGIEHVLNRKPKVLSGGQRQRVALGRAMVREPVVFLLDEPLSNLDVKMRMELREEILALHKRLKTTFLYVTHDQGEAMQMGDRIAVMDKGEIVQLGTPQEVYSHPANTFVADFIGAPKMNFFASKLIRRENGWAIKLFERELCLPEGRLAEDKSELASGMHVIVGIRPEDFKLSADGMFEARLGKVLPMGSCFHAEAELSARRFLMTMENNVRAREGDLVRLKIDMQSIQLFDADSKQNLCISNEEAENEKVV